VRDDDELEIRLLLSSLDDVVKRLGQRLNVFPVQIRRRLVERDEAAVDPETFRQGQSDDDACEHSLPGAAPPAHVHLHVLFDHADAVVVGFVGFARFVFGADEDRVDVGTLVRSLPQLLDDAVDLFHLDAVVFHNGPVDTVSICPLARCQTADLLVQRTSIPTEVFNGCFTCLRAH